MPRWLNPKERFTRRRLASLLSVLLVVGMFSLAWLAFGGGQASGDIPEDQLTGELRAFPEYSLRWRLGFGCAREHGYVSEYDVGQLCAGWYHDWGTLLNPPRPDGMEYIQTIRVSPTHFDLAHPENFNWADLDRKIRANPGSIWTIGNEPDGRAPGACDRRSPTEYAQIYKIFYDHIKAIDPTAKISNGPIIQGTPIRIDCWLTETWNEYRRLYGTDMPVDVWNMHNQIVKEKPSEGADIPIGCDPSMGMNYGVQDNDNLQLFIEHIRRMRQWMKDHGQQNKPLILSEYGVLQPEYEGFTADRINQYMNATFTYLLYARDHNLGMPADDYHLVQRWAWFSLNTPQGRLGTEGGWNGNLFDPETHEITEIGRNYSRWACSSSHPTPTPSTTPLPPFVIREAEGGSVHGAMGRGEVQSASDCRYVYVPVAGSSTDGADVTYNVYVPNTGEYVLWGRGWGIDYANRSFNLRVGSYPWVAWYFGVGGWNWQKAPQTYYLEGRRWHTIQIGPRVGGQARLDLLILTSEMSYDPRHDPNIIQVCNPTPTLTPTVTRTPTASPTPTVTRTPMPTGPARLGGRVALQGRGTPPAPSWQEQLLVSAHLPGDPIPAYLFVVESDPEGRFEVPTGVLTGTYDVGVRTGHSLRNLRRNISVTVNTPDMDMGTLYEGDANLDNKVNILDFSILASAYGTNEGELGFDPRADFNGDGKVNILDFSLLASNYGEQGDRVLSGSGLKGEAADGTSLLGTVTVRVQPSTSTVVVNQVFTVDVYAYAGSEQVRGVACSMSFDPTYLDVQSLTPGPTLNLVLEDHTGVGNGTIEYNAAKTGSPASGTFLLFTLTIRAKRSTSSTLLHFTDLTVADPDGIPIPSTSQDGTVVVLAASPTPTRTNTPVMTQVPAPTVTPTPGKDVSELVLRQGVDGYTGFEDTFIDLWDQTRNYAHEPVLKVRSQDNKRILIRADLSMLPPGTTIERAVLTLYETGGSANTIQGSVYGILRDWAVEQTTWISATQSTLWGLPGCSEAGTDRDSTPTYQRAIFPTWGSFRSYPFDFDVTALVQQWVDDPSSNKGLVIASSEGPSAEFTFGSSENVDPEMRPRLLIRYYSGPTPTATPTVTGTPPTPTPTSTVHYTPTVTPTPRTDIFGPVKDTYIHSWYPTNNYGGAESIQVRSSGVQRGLLQFDLSSIPAGSMVYEAQLRLYSTTSGRPLIDIAAYGLKRDWVEREATWEEAASGASWGSPGASNPSSDYNPTALDTQRVTGTGWYEWTVTDLVQQWVNDPSQNHGLLLIGLSGPSTVYAFSSREHGISSQRPQLVVRWLEVQPTPTPSPTPVAQGVIRGKAFEDRDGDEFADPGEPGVPGAVVELLNESDPSFRRTAVTAADGTYTFDALYAGRYRVRLQQAPLWYEQVSAVAYVVPVGPETSWEWNDLNFAL
ncbi:MAG: DNRLRE domain-containing protein, partial [Anaerolineae bacterium]|nr:DNRLRE domain-containing protein [Anaerolineae bacterium]